MSTDLAIPGAISETALELPPDLSFEEWERVGEKVGRAARASQWWVGDWLNFGERAYGEKYAQGMDLTGLDYETVRSYAWVAAQVETVRRRTVLSWSHHKEIAALNPAEQDRWLQAAEANGWSKRQLRKEIKGSSSEETECCPTCGRKLAGRAT